MRLDLETLVERVRGVFAVKGETTASAHSSNQKVVHRADILRTMYSSPIEEVCNIIGGFERQEVKDVFVDDSFARNYFLNLWEYTTGQDILESYPWNVTLPLADLCNARCTFCDAWLRGEGVMQLEDFDRFIEVLKFARVIGIQGHGEPLANPHINAILSRVGEVADVRARAYIITNGVFLEKNLDLLLRARVEVFNISLNATSCETHHIVMGLGEQAYTAILSTIRKLIEIRNHERPSIEVTISMVLTRDNIHEASNFIQLGNELGVNRIYLRTLMPISEPEAASSWDAAGWDTAVILPQGLNYHLLPPYLHPDFTRLTERLRDDIASSIVSIEAQPDTWSSPVLGKRVTDYLDSKPGPPQFIERHIALADKSIHQSYKSTQKQVVGHGELVEDVLDPGPNPYGRTHHFQCRYVYHNLCCNEMSYRMVPCCYMADVPGYRPVVLDGSGKFMDSWNSPAFVKLRQRLKHGPLFAACKTCPNQG